MADSGPLSSRRSPHAALKFYCRSDRVTRDGPVALRVRLAKSGLQTGLGLAGERDEAGAHADAPACKKSRAYSMCCSLMLLGVPPWLFMLADRAINAARRLSTAEGRLEFHRGSTLPYFAAVILAPAGVGGSVKRKVRVAGDPAVGGRARARRGRPGTI